MISLRCLEGVRALASTASGTVRTSTWFQLPVFLSELVWAKKQEFERKSVTRNAGILGSQDF